MSEKSLRNEAISDFPVPGRDRAGPFLPCRSCSGWKDEKTAPTEATGSILARDQEAKTEILATKEKTPMKRLAIGIAGSLMLFLLSNGFVRAQTSPFSGEIMDSDCAKTGSHAEMMKKHATKTEKACTLGCVKNGAKFVLYNPDSKTVYQLDDQKKPEQFAGEKVKVTGEYDSSTKTIHVTDIQSAS